MDKLWVTIPIILVIILSLIISNIRSNIKLKARLEESFGRKPEGRRNDLESIKAYWHYKGIYSEEDNLIDKITWDDLDMDLIFNHINTCHTSVGEEYLYYSLHNEQDKEDLLVKREKLLRYLGDNPQERLNLQLNLSKIGRNNYNGLVSFIYDLESKSLKHTYLYTILSMLPIICLIITIFNREFGGMALIFSLIVNVFIFYRTKGEIERELSSVKYFSIILHNLKKVFNKNNYEELPFLGNLGQSFNVFKGLESKLSNIVKEGFSDLDILGDYINIVFLTDIRNYNKSIRMISKYSKDFHSLYKCLGEVDMAICILSFRKSLPFYTLPTFHKENSISFSEFYHPLLSDPITNSGKISNNSIITGSNASGKSTFIKALAVNSILAQTINTCAAKDFKLRFSYTMTSMAVRDDITEGDSYFIKEIKSLKRILDRIQDTTCTCYIDEILKGTNTIERIAASAAVLKYLHGLDCLCVTASHDIELTRILSNEYDNYHFRETITDDGILFDYKLKEGPSQTRNAIKLLNYMKFKDQIVDDAESLVDRFVTTNTW